MAMRLQSRERAASTLLRIGSESDVGRSAATRSIRFGDEVVFEAAAGAAPRGATRQERKAIAVPSGAARTLHLVTQVGDVFRHEHPRVRVLVDKGRYLLVALDPATASRVRRHPGRCYRVEPWTGHVTAFETVAPRSGRAVHAPKVSKNAKIAELVSSVSGARLKKTVERLVAFKTRHSTRAEFRAAAEYVRGRLDAFGYTTRLEAITVEGKQSVNVVADLPGTASGSRRLLVVGAHLDSINLAGVTKPAPGADDNASGAAGALEMARLLAGLPRAHDLRILLFGGEEEGLFGSQQHVAAMATVDRARLTAMVNMDMIATVNTPARAVLLEGASVSRRLMDALAAAAATYTDLEVQRSLHPFNSDHVPFIDAGLPAVLTIEGTDAANKHVHTSRDTVEFVDNALMTAIVRMNLACIAQLATADAAHVAPATPQPRGTTITIRSGADAVEVLRSLPFRLSGCFRFNGGASNEPGRGRVDRRAGLSHAELSNPLYELPSPVLFEQPSNGTRARRNDGVRFTLRIDVDGDDALGVVSGTLAAGGGGAPYPHFVGKVTEDTEIQQGRRLVVGEFRMPWPGTVHVVDRIEIELSGSPLNQPKASVLFRATDTERDFGPFVAAQDSTYFREVEVEIDREVGALDAEPYATHDHPDRPDDLTAASITLEGEFAKAGVRLTRVADAGPLIDSSSAGADARWTEAEIHDSMMQHWQAFVNRPQWKMWIFLANRATDDDLGGVMFDGDIDEPGGVDRQGTAIFTQCPLYHTQEGAYCAANPPADSAARRELFFNLMHETGHAFNLAHSFQKESAFWPAPDWAPPAAGEQAMSWMNYPELATPGGGSSLNARWFYRRFRFSFEPSELLFLRHAPESFVQMGGDAWFENHGRAPRLRVDDRLKLTVRSRKQFYEYGEPVMLELKLENLSDDPLWAHRSLSASGALVEIAITNPRGERRPFLPFEHTRTQLKVTSLVKGEPVYEAVDVTMGAYGFHFKEPGAYRVEACYTNLDGGVASAVMRLFVRPPREFDHWPLIGRLFRADVGRVMYLEGTRVLEDVNATFNDVAGALGGRHPLSLHLAAVRSSPLARAWKVVEPSNAVRVYGADPDQYAADLRGVVVDRAEDAADTMGHIWYAQIVDTYTAAAVEAGKSPDARKAQSQMVDLFRRRRVRPAVIAKAEERLRTLR